MCCIEQHDALKSRIFIVINRRGTMAVLTCISLLLRTATLQGRQTPRVTELLAREIEPLSESLQQLLLVRTTRRRLCATRTHEPRRRLPRPITRIIRLPWI